MVRMFALTYTGFSDGPSCKSREAKRCGMHPDKPTLELVGGAAARERRHIPRLV